MPLPDIDTARPEHAGAGSGPGHLASMLATRLREAGEAPALRDADATLSAAALLDRAQACADALRAAGIRPGTRIMLDLPRSAELGAMVLGCVLAGVAYVPAPTGMTAPARDAMAEQTRSTGIVARNMAGTDMPMGARLRRLAAQPPAPTREIYCVRTSGTTGAPKVVPIREGNVLAFLEAQAEAIDVGHSKRWLWMHNMSFDLSVFEIFGALWHRGCLTVLDEATKIDAAATRAFIAREGIQAMITTPSEFRFMLRGGTDQIGQFQTMTHIVFCGEKLPGKTLAPVFGQLDRCGTQMINAYGPSEATVFCTAHRVTRADLCKPSLPLGRMLPRMHAELRAVQADSTGELVLHGPQVFAGYDGRPPVANGHPTGDICADRPDDGLVFLYREGGFTKVNGHRIDLAEIEEHLLRHPDIDEAVMLVARDEDDAQTLVACLRSNGCALDGRMLRAHSMALPPYLRPSRYVLHDPDTWPMTSHGKTDRKRLKEKANDQD